MQSHDYHPRLACSRSSPSTIDVHGARAIDLLEQFGKLHRHRPTGAQRIVHIQILPTHTHDYSERWDFSRDDGPVSGCSREGGGYVLVLLTEKVLGERWCVNHALQGRVEEARVTQVVKPHHSRLAGAYDERGREVVSVTQFLSSSNRADHPLHSTRSQRERTDRVGGAIGAAERAPVHAAAKAAGAIQPATRASSRVYAQNEPSVNKLEEGGERAYRSCW